MVFINADIDDFYRDIAEKKIVCYGAGGTLKEFCSIYRELHIQEKIAYVLDSNAEKEGSLFNVNGKNVPVISLKNFTALNSAEYVFLISCQDGYSVFERLQKITAFDGNECYYTEFIKFQTKEKEENNRKYPEDFRITKQMQIPKVIHYCWFGGKPIPERNREWMESWKKKCPDYEIMEWNEKNYDIGKSKFMKQAYEAKAWGFVPDYARLDIIYNYGGIYLDTDVEVVKNLDDLLYQEGFMGIDSTKDISLGLGFGAPKNDSFIKKLLSLYENSEFNNTEPIAAPAFMRQVFCECGYVNNGELQFVDGMTVYPEKVLSGKDNIVGLISTRPETFLVHHYDGSWCREEQIMRRNRMHKFYKEISR